MSDIKTVVVCGKTYNIHQASAVNQKKLMTLISGRIALNSASSGIEEINLALIVGVLISTEEAKLDQIDEIVLYKTALKGETENLVSIEDFRGNINAYFNLLAEGVKANLQDFFTWLDTQNAESREQKKA